MRMRGIRIAVVLSLLAVVAVTYVFLQLRSELNKALSEDPRVWEQEIVAFEQQDKRNPPASGRVLFLGSSSIRLWDSLADDMQPLTAQGRGFGGAKIVDISYHIERLIGAHSAQAVVLYIGANDLSDLMGNKAKTLEQVKPLYAQLVDRLMQVMPDVPVVIVALKPTERGWHQWPLLQQFNQYLRQLSLQSEQLYFVDANHGLLTAQGLPDTDKLMIDGVHANGNGYAVWGSNIKRFLLNNISLK